MEEAESQGSGNSENSWLKAAESIRLDDYTYDLPDNRIAKYPLENRDQSKLLIYKSGEIAHKRFADLAENVPAKTLLIFNDTKVIPARAYFKKETGVVIEILLLHPELPTRVINDAMLVKDSCVWECMIGNKKRWKLSDKLTTNIEINGQQASLSVNYENYNQNLVRLTWTGDFVFLDIVKALGEIPLPPYLNRNTEARDSETYQTVYAHHDGAVAAPTAGLHFTPEVFEKLQSKGVKRSFLTLHVGAGTFQPIKVSSVTEHRMHSEQVVFTKQLINDLLENLEMIIPVGTTSLRSLESLYWFGVKLFRQETTDFFIEKLYPYPFEEKDLPSPSEALHSILAFMEQQNTDHILGETEIFIFPGYKFRLCKAIVTNFHQPGSTLILLVAALTGQDWKRIYAEALENDYRFLSYGDSSLLWRKD